MSVPVASVASASVAAEPPRGVPTFNGATFNVTDLDATATITALRENRRAMQQLQANELVLLGHFADIRSVVDVTEPGSAGEQFGEQLVQIGHDGTPEVAEFAPLEVAAAFNESAEAASLRLAEVLDLRHRFPSLWTLVLSGRLKRWTASDIVDLADRLDAAACAEIDRRLAPVAALTAPRRLKQLVRAWVLELTPPEQQLTRRQRALASRTVEVFGEAEFGVAHLSATLDATDAVSLDRQVAEIAHLLGRAGASEPLPERRAMALGILSRPAQALSLLQAGLQGQLPDLTADSEQPDCPLVGTAGHACGRITVDPDKLLPRAEIVLHLTAPEPISADVLGSTDADAAADPVATAGPTLVRTTRMGPLLKEWLPQLLQHHRVSVRPVLDAASMAAVDCYEIPSAMREAVLLRSPYEAFPGSTRSGRLLDLDHTQPWQPDGPPGQTRPDNLAPLSRRTHRAKTHGRWTTHQVLPGVLLWRAPTGHTYVCTPSGRWCIDSPPGGRLAHDDASSQCAAGLSLSLPVAPELPDSLVASGSPELDADRCGFEAPTRDAETLAVSGLNQSPGAGACSAAA